MSKVIAYRFCKYDITTDQHQRSNRWATREAIERVHGDVLEDTATEVDSSVLGGEIDGTSARGFDPHSQLAGGGFQRQVYA